VVEQSPDGIHDLWLKVHPGQEDLGVAVGSDPWVRGAGKPPVEQFVLQLSRVGQHVGHHYETGRHL